MKIGFLLDDHMHRAAGVQEYVRGLVRYLEHHGHETVIFSGGTQFDKQLPERVIPLGVSVPFKGSGSSTSVPLVLQSNRTLRSLLHHEACDILHVQTPFSPTMSGRLLALSDAAHVSTFHIRIDDPVKLWWLRRLAWIQRGSFRRIHAKVAISRAAEETAQVLFPSTYTIIGVGVNTTAFGAAAELPRLTRYADGRVMLLAVGRLEERKGIDHLLRAYARLKRDHGAATRLVIGGDGPERENLQRHAAQLGLNDVEWLGYVPAETLPGLMASADIYCAPATGQESFGYVLIEAMAAGLPVVAYANAGYAGVLAQHPGNVAVPVGDDRALAGALGTFIASPALRKHVARNNRSSVAQHSWDSVGAQILEVYDQALAIKHRALGN